MRWPDRRLLFAICSAASLAGCVLLLAWWAGALFGEQVRLRVVGGSLLVFGTNGAYAAQSDSLYFNPAAAHDGRYFGPAALLGELRSPGSTWAPTSATRVAGIEYYVERPDATTGYRALVVPMAYPVALAAVLPACWTVARLSARRRRRRGLCAACGYDLRASPKRCPECGAVNAHAV